MVVVLEEVLNTGESTHIRGGRLNLTLVSSDLAASRHTPPSLATTRPHLLPSLWLRRFRHVPHLGGTLKDELSGASENTRRLVGRMRAAGPPAPAGAGPDNSYPEGGQRSHP